MVRLVHPKLASLSAGVGVRNGGEDKQDESAVHLFTKGAPEMIITRCRPETLPADVECVLEHATKQGAYVIALAGRALPDKVADFSPQELDELLLSENEEGETETSVPQPLDFLGLLFFENPLRHDTAESISELKCGRVKTVVVTGDSVWSGVQACVDSGVVDPETMCVVVADLNRNCELNVSRTNLVKAGADSRN